MSFNYACAFCKCPVCGREMLVERLFSSVDYTKATIVICKECLRKKGLDAKFKQENPELAKKIEEWLNQR